MIAGTLFRYFLKRHLLTIFWFFLGVTALIFLIDFIETSGLRGNVPGFTLFDSFFLTTMRVPLILQQTIPFIMLLAGITTLVSLNRRQEMVVTRAAGISVWQFMMPFITGAVITGLLALFVLNPLAAAGQRVAQQIEADTKATKQLSRRNQPIPWLRQITATDDVIIGAETVADSGRSLIDAVFIHFGPESRIVLRQDAASAKLEDGYWLLNKVTETRPGQIPVVLESARVRTNLKQDFIKERLSRPETVDFLGIPAKIEAARSFGVSTSALETQFHSLISMPFMLIAMTLISATVSLKFSRFNQSQTMIFGGVVSGFVLYVITVLVKAFGSSGVVPPFVAAWIPVVVAMFLGTTLFTASGGWLVAAGNRKAIGKLGATLLSGMVALGFLATISLPVWAQSALEERLKPKIPEKAKLLLTSSQLIYDRDNEKVTAVGGVQIDYGGYKLVAKRVEYNQKTGRMMAIGEIEMVEPSGNRVYADKLDVTDDFANGFLDALRVETTDNTRMVAVKGRRVNANELILEKGVYTACEVCKEHPEKPPLWQIKAERVIQNGKTHTVRLESAEFELFGKPIAFIPVLELPDNTVKRKSGFLFPHMSSSENLGFGLGIPYYQTLTPHMDATLTVTGYTTQGALIDAEFRQQFKYGLHTFHIAGIDQLNSDKFTPGTTDFKVNQRVAASSQAKFQINPRWTFGWDVLWQSDNNFARTYSLFDSNEPIHTNQTYLTGLGRRNSFDMRSFYFDVQDADPTNAAEDKQAVVHPVLDYNYIHPAPVLGGQLSATVNFQSLTRTTTDKINGVDIGANFADRIPGIAGTSDRLTSELEWKRSFVVPGGLVLTPLLAARGDGFRLDNNDPPVYAGDYYTGTDATRYMLTAGIEARYPILMTTDNASHIFEPIVQVYARPNEQMAGMLPNEDAQSLVFDASNLFERDKFSGFDRIEGGTRANAGFRYTGTFDNGYTIRSVFGQSYQLAGKNSFATHDLVNVGADSGLETNVSDYVGAAGVEIPNGMSFSLGGRADQKSLEIRRTDSTVGYNGKRLQAEVTYSHIAAQPSYGYPTSEEIQTTSTIKLKDNWSLYSSFTWDLNNNVLSRRGVGFGYNDGCTVFAIGFTQTRDIADTSANDWQIGARLSFRTIGDINVGDSAVPGTTKLDYLK